MQHIQRLGHGGQNRTFRIQPLVDLLLGFRINGHTVLPEQQPVRCMICRIRNHIRQAQFIIQSAQILTGTQRNGLSVHQLPVLFYESHQPLLVLHRQVILHQKLDLTTSAVHPFDLVGQPDLLDHRPGAVLLLSNLWQTSADPGELLVQYMNLINQTQQLRRDHQKRRLLMHIKCKMHRCIPCKPALIRCLILFGRFIK